MTKVSIKEYSLPEKDEVIAYSEEDQDIAFYSIDDVEIGKFENGKEILVSKFQRKPKRKVPRALKTALGLAGTGVLLALLGKRVGKWAKTGGLTGTLGRRSAWRTARKAGQIAVPGPKLKGLFGKRLLRRARKLKGGIQGKVLRSLKGLS